MTERKTTTTKNNMVTRTVPRTEASVTVFNKATNALEKITVSCKNFAENTDALKIERSIEKLIPENTKLISVDELHKTEECYCMPVAEFIASAMVYVEKKND